MTYSQLALTGDSLPAGTNGAANVNQGGLGSFADLLAEGLANLPIGPLLSGGIRGCWLGAIPVPTEWTISAGWTAVASTDAWMKSPSANLAKWGNGITKTMTWTKPAKMRPVIGWQLYMVDKTASHDPQYRIDGGTWTNMGQTWIADRKILAFRVMTPITATFDIRCYNGTSDVDCVPIGIEPIYSTATSGFVLQNLGVGGAKLNELVANLSGTGGDRMALLDSCKAGTGSPVLPTPNVGCINMNINDTVLNNTTTYATDLTTYNTRCAPLGPVGFINPHEVDLGVYLQSRQTNYRSQLKTTAAGFATPAKVFDLYDAWAALGYGTVTPGSIGAIVTSGGTSSDLTGTQTLSLDDASLFPNAGWAYVQGDTQPFGVKYAGKTSTSLLSCLTIFGSSAFSSSEFVGSAQNTFIHNGGPADLTVDAVHLNQAGHLAVAPRVYWWVRNQILGIGLVPSTYVVSGKQAAVQYAGKQAAVQYSAGAPISV